MQAPLQARNNSDAAQTDTAKTVAQKRVLADNRPEAVAQRKLAEMMNNSPRVLQLRALSEDIHNSPRMVVQRHKLNALFGGAVRPQGDEVVSAELLPPQREENPSSTGLPNQLKSGVESPSAAQQRMEAIVDTSPRTSEIEVQATSRQRPQAQPAGTQSASSNRSSPAGLPDDLKSGIESLSGISMDHVKVHYNSSQPKQLNAHAYAQGTDIHLAPGQERHLSHEAWHIVQQAQGRVRPTMQMNHGVLVNNDERLEREADVIGAKAAQVKQGCALQAKSGAMSAIAVAQRIVIHGADANEQSDFAQSGFSRLISASEIQNTNSYLEQDKRDGFGVFSIEDINEVRQYDPVNYINGHFQPTGNYLGKSAPEMAQFFKDTGLISGQKLILLGCESANYAQELAVQLHEKGIDTTVTGGKGIAFDYHSKEENTVVEAMYDSKYTPRNEKLKYAVVTKYEEIFINEVIRHILENDSEEVLKTFMSVFTKIIGANLSHLSNSDLTLQQQDELAAAKTKFQNSIGKAPDDDAKLEFPMDAPTLIAISKEEPFPKYCKNDLIKLKSQAIDLLPKKRDRASSLEELKEQFKTGTFKLKAYTSHDQLWIRGFMQSVNAAGGDIKNVAGGKVKNIVQNLYTTLGRVAANEYILEMAKENDSKENAVIPQGWLTFDQSGIETAAHATYRNAADAK